METLLLFCIASFLAFANGANDNAKGVATLYGAGVLSYRSAIVLATLATFAGGVTALFLAQDLVAGFAGKGLVAGEVAETVPFAAAVGLGAAAAVLMATWLGLPVSTTHGLVGALLGAGLMATGTVAWAHLGEVFLLPLLASPILAGVLGVGLFALHGSLIDRATMPDCLCLTEEAVSDPPLSSRRGIALRLGPRAACEQGYGLRLSLPVLGEALHVLGAIVLSFGRGLNDTPKIAALLMLVPGLGSAEGMVVVAAAMALGGLLAARRVGETLGRRIIPLDRRRGLAATVSTAILVLSAGGLALPVSTTHCMVGALFGIGLVGGGAQKTVVWEILLAWVLTLPLALVSSAVAYVLISTIGIGG